MDDLTIAGRTGTRLLKCSERVYTEQGLDSCSTAAHVDAQRNGGFVAAPHSAVPISFAGPENRSRDLKDTISFLTQSRDVVQAALDDPTFLDACADIVERLVTCFNAGNKLLIAGNGGSAADAQHVAGEFVSRLYFDRPPLPAIALTTDSSVLTAVGNDYGYEKTFERQILALGQKGDVFIAISTSGRSPNILRAMEAARTRGVSVVSFTGATGGSMAGS